MIFSFLNTVVLRRGFGVRGEAARGITSACNPTANSAALIRKTWLFRRCVRRVLSTPNCLDYDE